MNKKFQKAFLDVGLFLLGITLGIIMECPYSIYIVPMIQNKSGWMFIAGLSQIFLNSLILIISRDYIENSGFLMIGLLTPQLLIVKKLFGGIFKN